VRRGDNLVLADFVAGFPPNDCLKCGGELTHVVPVRTPPDALTGLREALPATLPPLYEQLILSYRWPETDLGCYRLLANPDGPGLTGLLEEMRRDPVLWSELISRGWIPFGKGACLNYDPVCFDIRRRRKDGDCRVVQLDHEEILCSSRIREVAELAPSFRELVERTVQGSKLRPAC